MKHIMVLIAATLMMFGATSYVNAQGSNAPVFGGTAGKDRFFSPSGSLTFSRSGLTDEVLSLIKDRSVRQMLGDGGFAVERVLGSDRRYQVSFDGSDLQFASRPPVFGLPSSIKRLTFDLQVTLASPWSKSAAETGTLRFRQFDIRAMELKWGDVTATTAGLVDIDKAGRPTGLVDLEMTNWRPTLNFLSAFVPSKREEVFRLTSAFSDGDRLRLPLGMRNGRVSIDGSHIGTLPPLVLPALKSR